MLSLLLKSYSTEYELNINLWNSAHYNNILCIKATFIFI